MPRPKITARSVGAFLKQAREREQMTQSDVAVALGIAASYPSHDEVGFARVSPARLKQLSVVYKLTKAECNRLLDLAAEENYKRIDISNLTPAKRRKVLEAAYVES